MSLLKDFENRIETTLEGFFARRFKSGVHPVEVAKRLAREMDANRTIGVAKVYAPTEYVVFLSKKDYDRIKPYEDDFVRELGEFLVAHAAKEHYSLISRPSIKLKSKAGLVLGQMQIESVLASEPATPTGGGTEIIAPEVVAELKKQLAGAGTSRKPPRIELEAEGQSFALGSERLCIGRLASCEITLADANVSRRHAEIAPVEDGYEVVDLESTNGTLVNDELVTTRRLADGDRITIGITNLIYRDGSSD